MNELFERLYPQDLRALKQILFDCEDCKISKIGTNCQTCNRKWIICQDCGWLICDNIHQSFRVNVNKVNKTKNIENRQNNKIVCESCYFSEKYFIKNNNIMTPRHWHITVK